MIRVVIYFVVPIVVGVVLVPFGIWASLGFPGEGSHGLWIPAMFAAYIGLPAGLLTGIIAASICFLRWRAKEKKENILAIDTAVPAYSTINQKIQNEK